MNRSLFLVLLLLFTLAACRKSSSKPADEKEVIYNEDPAVKDEDKILGVWLKRHLGSTPAPGDTLHFTQKNGTYALSFDCSGSHGPNWPSRAEVPYEFENGKLSYLSYFDNSGYFVATSFCSPPGVCSPSFCV